jgi:hypothetical protein
MLTSAPSGARPSSARASRAARALVRQCQPDRSDGTHATSVAHHTILSHHLCVVGVCTRTARRHSRRLALDGDHLRVKHLCVASIFNTTHTHANIFNTRAVIRQVPVQLFSRATIATKLWATDRICIGSHLSTAHTHTHTHPLTSCCSTPVSLGQAPAHSPQACHRWRQAARRSHSSRCARAWLAMTCNTYSYHETHVTQVCTHPLRRALARVDATQQSLHACSRRRHRCDDGLHIARL